MKRIILTLMIIWTVISVTGQPGQFFTSSQLSSTMISSASIGQDSEGYIWIGTEHGLNRYDGYHFIKYLHDKNDSLTIGHNLVSTLLCEKSGSVWVGTSKGLDKYDSQNNRFIHFHFPEGIEPRVSKIIRLRNGNLLVGTAGFGLFSVDEKSEKITRIHHFTTVEDDNFYSNLYEDSNGFVWKCDATDGITFNKIGSYNVSKHFKSNIGTPMAFAERNGDILILCLHGMLVYKNGDIKTFPLEINIPFNNNIVFRTLYKDKKGNIYIGTRGHGLFVLPPNSNEIKQVETDNPASGLNSSKVWSIFIDHQDNLWVGCQQKGLFMIPSHKPLFDSWSFSSQKLSIGTPVTSICKGDNNQIWCSVQSNGVYCFDNEGKIVSHPSSPPSVEMMYRDSKKNYWLTTDACLYKYQPTNGNSQLVKTFDCDKLNDITEDRQGKIYVSTFSRGFNIFDTLSNTFKHYDSSMPDKGKGRLCNNWINKIFVDKEGLIWFATATGISCYNPKKDSFNSLGWNCLLENILCYSLCEQKNGNILIGTEKGVYIWQRVHNRVIKVKQFNQLADKTICYIACDKNNGIWCSTNEGIWHFNQTSQKWVEYLHGNGLENNEYIACAGIQDNKDNIYFGTTDGIVHLQPQRFSTYLKEIGNIHLTSFTIAGKQHATKGIKNYEIPYQTNSFSLDFSLFDFTDAGNTIFEYKLNESTWTPLSIGQNVLTFNHLTSGTYNLKIRASVNGLYSPINTYTIIVTTPWYNTIWAWLCYIMFASIIIILLIRAYIREKNRQLDEEKMKFLINATHDIRSPLTLIKSPLSKLMKQHKDDEDKNELQLIEHNTQRILRLVNQILDIQKIDKQQITLQCEDTNLIQYVKVIYQMYNYYAKEHNIVYSFNSPKSEIKAWIDHTQFDKVINNILSNAFKYTPDEGHIDISIKTINDNMIQICVNDDGIGIKAEDIKHIFDRFYQGKNSHEGTGIGLNLCKMIVEMHHGSINASTGKNGKGTMFTICIPMGCSHLKLDEIKRIIHTDTEHIHPTTTYKLLLVDDDIELCEFVRNELCMNYYIDICHNGREAMRFLNNNDYNLVISDVMMPEMDGFTLLRTIKNNTVLNHIPVILLTSKADIANRMEGIKNGADVFIPKPFDIDELTLHVNNLISNRLRLKGKYSNQQLKEQIEVKEIKGNNELLFERVMTVINQHLDNSELDVELLSKEVGLSKTQLYKKMKEITGLNVAEFIRNIRLEQAARLLKEQKINVSQVAYSVGFNNLAHFSTLFKKHFGVTPSEYAKNIIE